MKFHIDEPVGVLGIGVEGRATIDFLLKHGLRDITALDRSEISGLPTGVHHIFGPGYDQDLDRYKTIFRSPGIRPDHPSLVFARSAGSRVTSAVSLFLERCEAPVIGITGTLGKGTASALTAELLTASGFTVHLGGNIGKSPLDFLDDVRPDHRVVLEISSFQAMDVTASPRVGVVLKTTSEHLDWHLDLSEYRNAKSKLFEKQQAQDTLIYNADSEGARQVSQGGGAKRLGFSLEAPVPEGIYFDGDRLMLSENSRRSPLNLSISKLRLPGKFNLENIAAAALAAMAAGASPDAVGTAAEAFDGLPHRLQYVTKSKNVRFFNDSYATRPDATLGAIAAFENTPLAIILGGSEKFADFGELAERLRRHPSVIYAALIGQTAKRLNDALLGAGGCGFPVHIHEGLEDATRAALKALAPNGGVLLLSPACASFGLFPNYKVRGERFVELVHSLTDDH